MTRPMRARTSRPVAPRSNNRWLPVSLLAASLATLALPLLSGTGARRARPASNGTGAVQGAAQSPAHPVEEERFDNLVRDEMFAGMAGDRAAFDRAMKRCEQALATNSKDPQALVWHGSGLVFQAGQLFRSGDYMKGKEIIIRGFKEMDDAVALAPNDIPVLIPRGASLLSYAKYSRDPERSRPRLLEGLADYEKVLEIQNKGWSQLPVHSRGELLSGLVEGWVRGGDAAKARTYAQRIVEDLPGTRYAARAEEFLAATPAPTQVDWPCIGCHAAMSR